MVKEVVAVHIVTGNFECNQVSPRMQVRCKAPFVYSIVVMRPASRSVAAKSPVDEYPVDRGAGDTEKNGVLVCSLKRSAKAHEEVLLALEPFRPNRLRGDKLRFWGLLPRRRRSCLSLCS